MATTTCERTAPRNRAAGNRAQPSASTAAPLAMDVCERAHRMDRGAPAAHSVDGFSERAHGNGVGRRFDRAVKAARALQA